ncbi:hypothetical protein AWZ86_23760 [Shigella sonnei]|nr:hypothetical protein AWZ86_23760 [Shigella sonnei]
MRRGKAPGGDGPAGGRREGGLLGQQGQFPERRAGGQGAQGAARQGRRDRNGGCKPGFSRIGP